ncbi:MAG: DOMON-like domain-containing protein [Vitreimonas sp.]
MRVALKPHPDTPARAVRAVEVEIGPVSGAQLRLRYVVSGEIARLALPEAAPPERADELWKHTCFEAFAMRDVGYREFNFSPSTEWAAYDFDGYRAGVRKADVLAPRIEGRHGQEHYELHVAFDLPGAAPWRLALSAVIEETDGVKSYWALKHPPGQPDFHHADGFVLELP